MKKTVSILVTVLTIITMFTGCGSTLPKAFDEAEVIQKVQDIIGLTFEDNYEAIMEMGSDVFSQLTVEDFRSSVNNYVSEAGEFKEISKTVVGGSKENGIESATTVSTVKCSNGNLTFTISLDTDMKISGYYVK